MLYKYQNKMKYLTIIMTLKILFLESIVSILIIVILKKSNLNLVISKKILNNKNSLIISNKNFNFMKSRF